MMEGNTIPDCWSSKRKGVTLHCGTYICTVHSLDAYPKSAMCKLEYEYRNGQPDPRVKKNENYISKIVK